MKLIKVKYYCSGYTTNAAGNKVKIFKKRLHLHCPACNKVVIRYCFGSVKAKTCGCTPYKKHGMSAPRHPIYGAWRSMKDRCNNPNSLSWKMYGGRGISICSQWHSFSEFHAWAIDAGWKPKLMLDRINPNGNYEPSNCRWTAILQSNRNRRSCITEAQAVAVRALLKLKTPRRTIAEAVGVKLWTVHNIAHGLCWKGLS